MTRESQAERILTRLKEGPATTMELIADCRCVCPTKRISELRRSGAVIISTEKRKGQTRVVTYKLEQI